MKTLESKRVKWLPTKEAGIFISESLFYSEKYGRFYNAKIDEIKMTFSIFDTGTGRTVYKFEGVLTSKQNLKRRVRHKLAELGVEMGFETRDFRKGE